jgi:putative component of membrane protein insertase Oxa1/YidC/SpoIIIJ protein YidD
LQLAVALLLLAGAAFATRYDAASIAGRWAIDVYKANLSPLQAEDVCNFNPTCSQFSKQAIDRCGAFWGVLMTADRLERCNPFAHDYLGEFYFRGTGNDRINDPVEDHVPFPLAAYRLPLTASSLTPTVPDANSESLADGGLRFAVGEKQLAFADYLFRQEDYDRAIGEYRRVLFIGGSRSICDYARMMVAESYLQKGDFVTACTAFQTGMSVFSYQLADLGLARSLMAEGRYDAARHYAVAIRDSSLRLRAAAIGALCSARQYDFAAAAYALRSYPQDTALYQAAQLDGKGISRRNRAVSTVLSVVIPGLGQTYSGRLGDGLYSLAIVGVAGAASYYYWVSHQTQDPSYVKFGIMAGLGTIFYLGNVYGANTAARDYNLLQKRNYLARIESVLSRVDLQPDYGSLLGP